MSNRCVGVLDGKSGDKMTTVVATAGAMPDRAQEITYVDTNVIGKGSFGIVYQARLMGTNEIVAIKKVMQDKRFKVSEREGGALGGSLAGARYCVAGLCGWLSDGGDVW